jgi:DNA-binding MarR family transcriptional regulator
VSNQMTPLIPRGSTEYQRIDTELHTAGGYDRKTNQPRSVAEREAAVQAEYSRRCERATALAERIDTRARQKAPPAPAAASPVRFECDPVSDTLAKADRTYGHRQSEQQIHRAVAQDARSVGAFAGQAVMKPRFAPIPARAARDRRLSARHWRVLAVIANHDQLDGNGAGCWASQRRLAHLLGMDEADFSNLVTDLRTWGYINATTNPNDQRRRILRVIYNERDRTWDTNTWPASQVNTWTPDQPSGGDTWENQARYLGKSGQILGKNGVENDPKPLNSFSETDRTYVNKKEHIRESELVDGTDCAKARLQGEVSDAEKYLTELETLVASKDRDRFRFERAALERLASDACLPEALIERAARLLSQIG